MVRATSRPLYPLERPGLQLYRRMAEENLAPTGFLSQKSTQSVASRYGVWVIPAHLVLVIDVSISNGLLYAYVPTK